MSRRCSLTCLLSLHWRFGLEIIDTETTDAYCPSFFSRGPKPAYVRYQLYESNGGIIWIYTTRTCENKADLDSRPLQFFLKCTQLTRLCVILSTWQNIWNAQNFSEEMKLNYSYVLLNHTNVLQEKQSQDGSEQLWNRQALTKPTLNLTALEWLLQQELKRHLFQFMKFSELQAGRRPGRLTSFMISLSWRKVPLPWQYWTLTRFNLTVANWEQYWTTFYLGVCLEGCLVYSFLNADFWTLYSSSWALC